MSDGRTIWRSKDSLWHEREWIVTLVDEFGPAGYAVIDYLEAMAKLQKDAGRVKTGPRGISRATGADVVTVGHVVSRSVTLGLVDEYEDRDGRFTCRITWFEADQGKAMAADRKRRQRSGETTDTDDSSSLSRSVTPSHGESRSVTECPPTEQNRTEQQVVGEGLEVAPSSSRRSRAEVEKATDDDKRLCRLLADKATAHNPKVKVGGASWLKSMRLLRETDGNPASEIEQAIRWIFEDPAGGFWANTIQSPSGLRKNFALVWAQMHTPASSRRDPDPAIADLDAKRLASMKRLMKGEAA